LVSWGLINKQEGAETDLRGLRFSEPQVRSGLALSYGMRWLQLLFRVLVVRRAGHGRHFTQNFVVAANDGPSAIDRVAADLGPAESLVELLLCTGLGGQVVQLSVRSVGKQQLARLKAQAEFIRSVAVARDEIAPEQELLGPEERCRCPPPM